MDNATGCKTVRNRRSAPMQSIHANLTTYFDRRALGNAIRLPDTAPPRFWPLPHHLLRRFVRLLTKQDGPFPSRAAAPLHTADTVGQLKDVVVRYLTAHSETRHEEAEREVLRALTEASRASETTALGAQERAVMQKLLPPEARQPRDHAVSVVRTNRI